jgi:hypothetical protein
MGSDRTLKITYSNLTTGKLQAWVEQQPEQTKQVKRAKRTIRISQEEENE